jgi:hypothetical protein
MARWNRTTPPTWAPNSVPGLHGWYHPETRELLVALKVAPVISTVSAVVTAAKIHRNQKKFRTGDVIRISVTFNKRVIVTGSPRVAFTINGVAKTAIYNVGSDTANLDFTYLVQSGDVGTAGQVVIGIAATPAIIVSGTSNSQLKLVAKSVGTGGNATTLTAVNPGTNNAALSISVASTAITVNLATNGSAAATSTVAQIVAAIIASAPAVALVTASTGSGNGTGVFVAIATTALAGGTNASANSINLNGGTIVGRVNFATLTSGTSNFQVLFTAVSPGVYGNNVSVRIVNPGTVNAPLVVSVIAKDITISLATNGSSVATSTSSLVLAAVNASLAAKALVSASVGTGDGTGVVVVAVKTSLAGGSAAPSSTAVTLTFTPLSTSLVTVN